MSCRFTLAHHLYHLWKPVFPDVIVLLVVKPIPILPPILFKLASHLPAIHLSHLCFQPDIGWLRIRWNTTVITLHCWVEGPIYGHVPPEHWHFVMNFHNPFKRILPDTFTTIINAPWTFFVDYSTNHDGRFSQPFQTHYTWYLVHWSWFLVYYPPSLPLHYALSPLSSQIDTNLWPSATVTIMPPS